MLGLGFMEGFRLSLSFVETNAITVDSGGFGVWRSAIGRPGGWHLQPHFGQWGPVRNWLVCQNLLPLSLVGSQKPSFQPSGIVNGSRKRLRFLLGRDGCSEF